MTGLVRHIALAVKLDGHRAERVGNVFVRGEELQIGGGEARQKVQRDVDRSLGVTDKIFGDRVAFHKFARQGNGPQRFLRDIAHRGKAFHFGIRQARRLQHAFLNEFVGVADEQHAGFAVAFERQSEPLDDGHAHDFFRKRFAFDGVRLDLCGGFLEILFRESVFRVNFAEQRLLSGGSALRLGESGNQRGIGDEPLKIVEQGLNSIGSEMTGHVRDQCGRARRIFCQRVGDARLVAHVLRAKGEEARIGVGVGERSLIRADGQAEQDVLGAFGDGFVRIGGKHGEQFDADFGRQRNSAGADGEFAFRARVAGADFFSNFGANKGLPPRFSGRSESA